MKIECRIEQCDPQYEANIDDMERYGQFLEIDLKQEGEDVIQLVQAMLHDGFPPEWLMCKTEKGKVFYICLESMEYFW